MTIQEQRQAVLAEARRWLGTPYHHRGRIRGVGVDCAMLPAEVYAACGLIPKVAIAYYPPDWHLHRGGERYLGHVLANAHPVLRPMPGDLCLWRFGRCLAHGAIVVSWPVVIHAVAGLAVLEEDASTRPLLSQIGESGKPREVRFFSLWGESP